MIARAPLTRTRRKPKSQRHFKTPRCVVRGCVRPQMADERCRSHAKQWLDQQWSLQVRVKGECEALGIAGVNCGGVLQAAHGFPRTYLKTRHVLLNGFCICAGHHRWFTSHPLEWTQFMQDQLGDLVYENLRLMALGKNRDD